MANTNIMFNNPTKNPITLSNDSTAINNAISTTTIGNAKILPNNQIKNIYHCLLNLTYSSSPCRPSFSLCNQDSDSQRMAILLHSKIAGRKY